MINIAVCDDDILFTGSVEQLLSDYFKASFLDFDIHVYFDGSSLVKSIKNGASYDIIFMDIEMKKMDGIEAARMIRQDNPDVILIYVSSHVSYAAELFEFSPFRFIQKPVYPENFKQCVHAAVEHLQTNQIFFHYTSYYHTMRVPVQDIFYFESRNRKIYLHHKKGTDSFYNKLSNIESELKAYPLPFLRIHQSFLVNYKYIQKYTPKYLILDNGEQLPISFDRQRKIKNQYHQLILQNL